MCAQKERLSTIIAHDSAMKLMGRTYTLKRRAEQQAETRRRIVEAAVDLHGTVRVGGLTIRPGDLLHADGNGVTTVPLEIAGEVADAAVELVAAEAILLDYLKSGAPQTAAYVDARRAMFDALGALSRRLKR